MTQHLLFTPRSYWRSLLLTFHILPLTLKQQNIPSFLVLATSTRLTRVLHMYAAHVSCLFFFWVKDSFAKRNLSELVGWLLLVFGIQPGYVSFFSPRLSVLHQSSATAARSLSPKLSYTQPSEVLQEEVFHALYKLLSKVACQNSDVFFSHFILLFIPGSQYVFFRWSPFCLP